MSSRTFGLPGPVHDYLITHSRREPEVLARLRRENSQSKAANMAISPEQAQFMALLAAVHGTRRYLELGTFTGYSSLAMAMALPPDGRVVTCDISADYTATAQRYWAEAGVAGKIELRLQPALQALDEIIAAGEAASFDMAFIDADKSNYPAYYEKCMELVRPGGIILLDNMFWDGAVADLTDRSEDTEAIRSVAQRIHGDDRIQTAMLPLADGLTIAYKKLPTDMGAGPGAAAGNAS